MSLLGRLFTRGGMEHYRQGIFLFNQKDYERAAREFELALTAMGDRNNPYHSLGRFYAAEAHAKLGFSLAQQGLTAEARRQFQTALDQGYRYPDLHYFLARILEGDGFQNVAEEHCREALEINGGYLEARALLAIILWNQGRAEEALAELRRLAETDFRLPPRLNLNLPVHLDETIISEVREETLRRQESHEHLKRALEAYDQGDKDTALEEMRLAVEQKPGYADLRCKLGILYLESGALDLAREQLSEALRINPNYVEARLQMGLLLLRQNHPEEAAEHLGVASRLQPQYPDVVLFCGVAELRRGNLAGARRTIEEALSAHPQFHRARYFLALTLACLGETENSLLEMRRALEGDPNLLRARNDLAHLYLRQGEFGRAEGLFQAVLERHPEFPDAQLGMGLVLVEAGRRQEAREHLRKAVALHPGFVRALEALARLELSEGDLPTAERLLRQALEQEAEYPDLHYLLGQCLERQKREAEAIPAYERALEGNPRYLDARLALGLLLLREGQGERGRFQMGRVLQLDPAHPVARALADPALLDEL